LNIPLSKSQRRLTTTQTSPKLIAGGLTAVKSRFRLDIRKILFTIKVVKPWHRFPREVVEAPSLERSKARLDGALSSLIYWKVSLHMAEGLG